MKMKYQDKLVLISILQSLNLTPDQIQGVLFLIMTYKAENSQKINIIPSSREHTYKKVDSNANIFPVDRGPIFVKKKKIEVFSESL